MALDKNQKYKTSFDDLMRQLREADMDDGSSESLEAGVVVEYGEESSESEYSSSYSECDSSEDDESVSGESGDASSSEELFVQPGESFTISGGKISRGGDDVQYASLQQRIGEQPKKNHMYCTSEQLSQLRIREDKAAVNSAAGLVDPNRRKKKVTKRCPNIDY
ncbi:hypothetical protein PAPHI01_2323 [Pancytospora philotis]|nr:hypothetical protein PAPHI01_2323 [Pancytospora philotis]